MQVGQTLAMYQPTAASLLEKIPSSVAGVVVAIGSTGMAVAAILGILLDNLIPGTPQERGLVVESAGATGEPVMTAGKTSSWQLPIIDHQPQPYSGPAKQEVVALRQQYVVTRRHHLLP